MISYVGIDLGTTNSAVCTYDGSETRIWKSPEQNDVTPSAIYIDRRGNKYVGKRAYDSAPHSPDNAAQGFKRLMGTSTAIKLAAVELSMTPEECSAEILRVLFGYLPEELRNDDGVGTVITVPAAFNQMQKNATMQAAELAGIGRVALMQEPVAAVMSVMKARNTDGIFVVYDLGGGTLDVALAESIGGRVSLLAHGGIAMCGGRDFDRLLLDNVVKPWLLDNFDLPDDLVARPEYKPLLRLAVWAAERAKIELSARDDAIISLSETEARVRDLSGSEIYIDIPIERNIFDQLIEEKVGDSLQAARETLERAGLTAHDIDRIVFVGGPTNYKPLRDKISFELGIPGSGEVNPMTAVAEGAAVFAESVEWSSENRGRKSNRGKVSSSGSGIEITFNYTARTPGTNAKIMLQLRGDVAPGTEFQIDDMETGWTSGRLPLRDGAVVDVALAKNGENAFKVIVLDASGGSVKLQQDRIVITRTAATVDAIPASHSIGIEAGDRMGGKRTIEWIIKAGDQLPKKGRALFKAETSLKSGSSDSINFRLYEGSGESDEPADNRFIGQLKVSGKDFDDGVIAAGADLECEFEMMDSGAIVVEVSVPSIGGVFHSGRNFYSWQGEGFDFNSEAARERVAEEGAGTLHRVDELENLVEDPRLGAARRKLERAAELDPDDAETEGAQEAMEGVLEARRLLAQVRKDNLKQIRQLELDEACEFFNDHIREHARPSEETAFDNLVRTAQRSIDRDEKDFEALLSELRGKNFAILWRQDWFVIDRFKSMASTPHRFSDMNRFKSLVSRGLMHLEADEIDALRQIVGELYQISIQSAGDSEMLDVANIIRG